MISRSKILILDESHVHGLLTKYRLERFGFTAITIAPDSKWAMEEVINVADTQDCYELIICSYRLKGFSGLDLVKEVRSEEIVEYTKFLMLVNKEDDDAINLSLSAGADACLLKPINEIDLVETITDLFSEEREGHQGRPLICYNLPRKVNE